MPTTFSAKQANRKGAKIIATGSFEETVNLVMQGKADATLNDNLAFYSFLSANKEAPLKMIPLTSHLVFSVAIVKRGNKELLNAINSALEELRNTGELSKISHRFFNKDIKVAIPMREF